MTKELSGRACEPADRAVPLFGQRRFGAALAPADPATGVPVLTGAPREAAQRRPITIQTPTPHSTMPTKAPTASRSSNTSQASRAVLGGVK